MTKKEVKELGFDEAVKVLSENGDIATYDELKDFIISQIEDDNFTLAKHIINSIDEDFDSDYYYYDYSMGIFATPKPLRNVEDLLELNMAD